MASRNDDHAGRLRVRRAIRAVTRAVTTITLAAVAMAHVAAAQTGLDLANQPLFIGYEVPPNIMVAVDDSGSMDFETLFPTDSGLLYWDTENKSAWTGSGFVQTGGIQYAYLFPNGDNGCNNNGCAARDRRVYADGNGYYALPPIPALAFARSPQYNSAYFDPAISYTPWITDRFDNVDPTSAPADPATGNSRFDLTNDIRIYQTGYVFAALNGMPFGNVTYADGYVCTQYYNYYGTNYCIAQAPNWHTSSNNYVFDKDQLVGIEYFPATFYLPEDKELPESYSTYSGPTLPGDGPNGEKLSGYRIKPEYLSDSQYRAAITNFANWFTYYRKRHLATRGGIVAAFDGISRGRVGQCTINGADDDFNAHLEMRALDDPDDPQARDDFYSSIFNLDFSHPQGTPNRVALQYLGSRLEQQNDLITSPCQQNFAILFTDGYNTDPVRETVGNADGESTAASDYGKPFSDDYSNTIADVAMHYYEDLSPANSDIDKNRVPVRDGCDVDPPRRPDPELDCENDLHMVTFGVTLDQRGTIFNHYDTEDHKAANADRYSSWPSNLDWPNPIHENSDEYGVEQIDDLWHATINTRGRLLNADTPAEIANEFTKALTEITARRGAASRVAADTASQTADSVLYQASFVGGVWTGDLTASPSDDNAGNATDIWSAAELLSDRSSDSRDIITAIEGDGNDYHGNNYSAAAFNYNAVRRSSGNDLTPHEVAFIRGDRDNEENKENGTLRNRRDNILGDIVHSTPLHVGAPDRSGYPARWRDLLHENLPAPENNAGAYSDPGTGNGFVQRLANRTPMVYVGANDGMLHGFAAASGSERIAYVPNDVLPELDRLTRPNYAHRYYVDGSPVESDVVFGGAWHTVLVGGLGNGGNSVYALDITDPDDFDQAHPDDTFLWEFTDDQLGQTFGRPSIVRLHDGRWAAMVANGYNSAGQGASLYLLDIEDGHEIARIDTPPTASANNGQPNGLAEPFAADLDGDFIVDYAYAGDLHGNLWKFDLTSDNPGDWSARRLFQTSAPDGDSQPITTQPQVGVHPYGESFGVMVYVGTGKYLEPTDAVLETSKRNSVYGVWDTHVVTATLAEDERGPANGLNRSLLVGQGVVGNISRNGQTYRLVSNNPVAYDVDTVRGWVLDLPPDTGELIVDNPRLQDSTVAFTTLVPSQEACAAGGSGFFMRVDQATGGRTTFPAFDVNGDRAFDTDDEITVSENNKDVSGNASGVRLENGGTGPLVTRDGNVDLYTFNDLQGRPVTLLQNPGIPDGRRSWREIRR